MRARNFLVLAFVLLATLPALAPTSTACHPTLASAASAGASPPEGPHKGPADAHFEGCDHWPSWVCVHTRLHDECVQTG